MASTHILATGTIKAGGEIDWDIAPLEDGIGPDYELDHYDAELAAQRDGRLQGMIDFGAELQELIDGRLDDEYHASGNW